MCKLLVAGIGTGVGKTVVAAILTTLLRGAYWKPIECGPSDTAFIKKWSGESTLLIYPPAYSFRTPVSPHYAARLENITIDPERVVIPQTQIPLIIEGVGGIFVPLTDHLLSVDLFKVWDCRWIIISRHYLGSINHTLLTIDALKREGVRIEGLIFNGPTTPSTEEIILKHSHLPCLGKLSQEKKINRKTIYKYVQAWQPLVNRFIL